MRRRLKSLLRDRGGASIIELAVVLPVVCLILAGLVDVASCYSAQMSLQQAAARALERVQTTAQRADYSYVQGEAAAAASVPPSQVSVQNWLECDDQRQASYGATCAPGQRSARYVEVTVNASYSPFFNFTPLGERSNDGSVPLSASSSVRVQ